MRESFPEAILRRAKIIAAACGLALASAQAIGAPANDYPRKPVRILLGIAPGGSTDIVTRAIAQKLTERWGRPFVVDNRSGGAGSIAMELTAQAAPDGYTLFVAALNNTATARMLKKVNFDPVMAYAPVVQLETQPYFLMVNPALPAESVKEVIAYAKTQAGALNYASSGAGTASHLGMELFKSMTGVDIAHVPYRGGAPAMIALISGQVQVLLGTALTIAPHVKSGKLKALAVTSLRRSPAYPNLPTVAESGVAGFEVSNSHGTFAPAATPAAVILALNREINVIMQAPEMKASLAADGAVASPPNSPADFKAAFGREVATWEKFFKAHPALVNAAR